MITVSLSSMYGYSRSIRALLEISRAGIRVLPFLGYSLLIVSLSDEDSVSDELVVPSDAASSST